MISGGILLWSGAIVDIPSGFVLCNGANGTPDLRDKFVVGAGSTYNPADTGGSAGQTHTFTGDGHEHTQSLSPGGPAYGDAPDYKIDSTAVTGTTDNADNRPPYYSLAYIMKT